MLISSATPSQLIRWFHSEQSSHSILCILIATSRDDQNKLIELIDDKYTADAVLGSKVAFLLIHPRVSDSISFRVRGNLETLGGVGFPRSNTSSISVRSLKNTFPFNDLSSTSDWEKNLIAKETSRAMAHFAPDFMHLLDITPRQIPALCVLVRGVSEVAVLDLKNSWGNDQLLVYFEKIRVLVDQINTYQNKYDVLANSIPKALTNLKGLIQASESKKLYITNALERILRRHNATNEDREKIVELIARGLPSCTDLHTTLENLTFSNTDAFCKNQQIEKIHELMLDLSIIRSDILENDSKLYLLNVGEKAKDLILERSKLLEKIQTISSTSKIVSAGNVNFKLAGLKKHIENVNLIGDIGEKLYSSIEWIRKLIVN